VGSHISSAKTIKTLKIAWAQQRSYPISMGSWRPANKNSVDGRKKQDDAINVLAVEQPSKATWK
jgi:hypothetical protein